MRRRDLFDVARLRSQIDALHHAAVHKQLLVEVRQVPWAMFVRFRGKARDVPIGLDFLLDDRHRAPAKDRSNPPQPRALNGQLDKHVDIDFVVAHRHEKTRHDQGSRPACRTHRVRAINAVGRVKGLEAEYPIVVIVVPVPDTEETVEFQWRPPGTWTKTVRCSRLPRFLMRTRSCPVTC